MSNLFKLNCYLGGPIEFANEKNPDNETQKFFDKDKTELLNFLENRRINIIDPNKLSFNGISEIQSRRELFKDKDFKEIRRQMKIIVRKDLRCVDLSDFMIALLPKGIRTTGTHHEIINCDLQRKPSLILCPEGIEHIPAWFFGIIPLEFMFSSVKDMINYLEMIDNLKEEYLQDHNRWQFILGSLEKEKSGF